MSGFEHGSTRHRHTGVSPVKDHQDDEELEPMTKQEVAERTGFIQCIEG